MLTPISMETLMTRFRIDWLVLIIAVILSVSSVHSGDLITTDCVAAKAPLIVFDAKDLEIDGDLQSFTAKWATRQAEEQVSIVTLTLSSERPAVPPEFDVRWKHPSVDIHGTWTPRISLDKGSLYNSVTSRAVAYAPVVCLFNQIDRNRVTLAVSETLNRIETGTWIREEDVNSHFYVSFFKEKNHEITEYSVQFRIDTRDVHYSRSLGDVARWWASLDDHEPAPVPECARYPLYSTWYSFHQSITADEIVEQCALAKPLGFDALIVDDGWQTMDDQRGYRFTGDWRPDRIGDMKSFVDRVHELDVKFLLWYSLPFIGENAENFKRFEGKYLKYWESQGAWVLDPRYPETREFIIQTYVTAMLEWGLDGFKLDFMGWFKADEETVLTAEDGRDHASVDQATDQLMTDIMTRLRAMNKDVMIEFRQPYIGPRMRKYGNMFRATDCPNNALVNRVRVTDVRLIADDTAVHSDMYVWHNDEPAEQAALQYLNVLFAVPQLSVKLNDVSEKHLAAIKFWTGYWKDNRATLLDGSFLPSSPDANYPTIRARSEDKTIIAVYDEVVVPIDEDDSTRIDIVNGKISTDVVLDIRQEMGKRRLLIYDCAGELALETELTLKKGPLKITVPSSGLISLTD